MDKLNTVEFIVPLSGSQIFDITLRLTTETLCAKYPGLKYEELDKKHIRIFGNLNDYWYNRWNRELFDKMSND